MKIMQKLEADLNSSIEAKKSLIKKKKGNF
jgi:hypothetical protein